MCYDRCQWFPPGKEGKGIGHTHEDWHKVTLSGLGIRQFCVAPGWGSLSTLVDGGSRSTIHDVKPSFQTGILVRLYRSWVFTGSWKGEWWVTYHISPIFYVIKTFLLLTLGQCLGLKEKKVPLYWIHCLLLAQYYIYSCKYKNVKPPCFN